MNLKITVNGQPVSADQLALNGIVQVELPDREAYTACVRLTAENCQEGCVPDNLQRTATVYGVDQPFGCFIEVDPATKVWVGTTLFRHHPIPLPHPPVSPPVPPPVTA